MVSRRVQDVVEEVLRRYLRVKNEKNFIKRQIFKVE